MKRRFLCLLLVLAMLASLIPMNVIAAKQASLQSEPYAFLVQPEGGRVKIGEELTVYWELNFTPVRLELRKYLQGTGTRPLCSVETLAASTSYTEVEAGYDYYNIRAYYNSTDYVESENFNITESNFHTIWFFLSRSDEYAVTWCDVDDGETGTPPEDPGVEGKVFAGWYTEEGELFDFATPITEDINLYATFVDPVYVIFYFGGGPIAYKEVVPGRPTTPIFEPAIEGKVFAGWYTENGVKFDFSTPITEDINLYATFVDPCTISGTVTGVESGVDVWIYLCEVGKDIASYETKVNADGTYSISDIAAGVYDIKAVADGYPEVIDTITIESDMTYDILMALEMCTVYFYLGETPVASQDVPKGGRAKQPADPSMGYMIFQGWYTENNERFDFSTPITEDINLYAWFVDLYTVSGTVTGVESGVDVWIYLYEEGAPEPAYETKAYSDGTYGIYDVVPATYTLKAVAEGYATFVTTISTFGNVTQDIEMGKKTYTVIFYFGDPIASQDIPEGGFATPIFEPAIEGKIFLGWYTEDGVKFDFSTPITEDINLYATFADEVLYGDVNGDGLIEPIDATLILQYCANWSVTINLAAADVNGDGFVEPIDATLIL